MTNPVQSQPSLDSLGKPFSACPTIRIFSDPNIFKNNLKQSALAEVADDLAGDMSSAWERGVIDALTTLSLPRNYASRCVLNEIDWYGKRGHFFVFIIPRNMAVENAIWEHNDKYTPQERVIKAWLNASSEGRQGFNGPGRIADASKNQRGAGDTALVRFDPLTWDPQNQFRDIANQMFQGKYGPYGTSPAEVLLHELVHAMRTVKGITDMTPLGPPFNDSFEEFAAGLITNIHTAEFMPAGLRASHTGFSPMPSKWNTNQGFLSDRENRENVKYLIRQDSSLCNNLAQTAYVNAWNPIRFLLRPLTSVAN